MKLLVTGGAGFIGSNFIRHILKEHPDWHVVNLDKLTYAGNLANLKDVEADPRYSFVKGDIANRELVDKLFREGKFDVVVNFAAESHVDRSILDPSPFIETNIKGTQVLLEAARTYPVKRFIQISTDEVYGSLGETGKFTEESPLRPNSPYAASKAAADLLCRAYHKAYGIPVIITRSSNNYGPYQFPEKLIPLMIRNALLGKPLPVYGEGENVRDWLYVEDNCRAIDLVLQKGRTGEVYNIGGSCEKRNIEVVEMICKILEELAP
ncbi:MAG: dTDP-glucose 4,6-dehydratase, partial [Candidatus Bipolaricaulaceae bacterium]